MLVITIVNSQVLSSTDTTVGATNTYSYWSSNSVGLSFDLSEVMEEIDSELFQLYLLNSNIYGGWAYNFEVALHNPGGYKYNCSLS